MGTTLEGATATGGMSGMLNMLEQYEPSPTKMSRDERNLPGTACEVMQQRIWEKFPEDLFEAVIARLPITTFFRFRSVCQKWNSILNSPSFSRICEQAPQANPWFYISTMKLSDSAMYNPSAKKWYKPAISLLDKKVMVVSAASAGGLMCLQDIICSNFYVFNPIAQPVKVLPPRSIRAWHHGYVGMTKNGTSSSGDYKILWLGSYGEYEVYESLKNSWTGPRCMPSNIKLPLSLNFQSQAVSIDGTLHFLRLKPDGIISYDMVTNAWKQSIIPLPIHLCEHTLVEFRDRIMLVGLLKKIDAVCVCIWELQKMTLLWKEVDRMPNIWLSEFDRNRMRMICLGNKGLFVLLFRSAKLNILVTYNFLSREWSEVPECALPLGRRWQQIACGAAFSPCLTAST